MTRIWKLSVSTFKGFDPRGEHFYGGKDMPRDEVREDITVELIDGAWKLSEPRWRWEREVTSDLVAPEPFRYKREGDR